MNYFLFQSDYFFEDFVTICEESSNYSIDECILLLAMLIREPEPQKKGGRDAMSGDNALKVQRDVRQSAKLTK
jgi:hypothetical protein